MTFEVSIPLLMDRLKSLPPHRFDELVKALDTPEIYLADSIRTLGEFLLRDLRRINNVSTGVIQRVLKAFRMAGGLAIDLRLMSALFELSVARNRKAMDTLHRSGYVDQRLIDELADRMGAARLCSSLFTKLADLMEEL